jgi:hypothetical protein
MLSVAGLVAVAPAAHADPAIPINWNVAASTHVKSLNLDVVVQNGTFNGSVDLGTGDLTGNLTLPPATASTKLFGLIPFTATFAMVPTGPITGHVDLSTLQVTTTASFNIKIPNATALGLPINLVGSRCQTSKPISVTLSGPVDLAKGGTFTGTYTIPPFKDCGLTTPLLNLLVPGSGNTLSASFAPPPAA